MNTRTVAVALLGVAAVLGAASAQSVSVSGAFFVSVDEAPGASMSFAWDPVGNRGVSKSMTPQFNNTFYMFLNKNQQFQSFATGMGSGQKYCCQNSVMGQVPSTFWTSTGTGTAGTCTTAETDVMFYSGNSNLLVAGYLHNVELGFTTAGDLVCARKTVAGQQYTVPVHFTKGVPPATAFELDSICTDKTSLANCPQ